MHRHLSLAASVFAALVLSACVVAPYRAQTAYADPGGAVVVTDVAPPPAYVEQVPGVAPFAGAVWIGGYWGWSGGRHVWVPGRWDHGRPGYHWEPHRWENRGGHWELHGGRWHH